MNTFIRNPLPELDMDRDHSRLPQRAARVFVVDGDGFAIYYLARARQIVSRVIVQQGTPAPRTPPTPPRQRED